VKAGARALGVAESFDRGSDRSVLCGAVVRRDRTADGFVFGTCTVGGTDATAAIGDLWTDLDREDVRVILVSGVAPAWFNVVDLAALHEAAERPVLSVSFEASPGLEPALREQFSGDTLDRRLRRYREQPPRRPVTVNDETVYVRAVGMDAERSAEALRAFTPAGGRPEPLRVARLAARAVGRFRDDGT
jgi:endonuclease V-like protein UPF0215 family